MYSNVHEVYFFHVVTLKCLLKKIKIPIEKDNTPIYFNSKFNDKIFNEFTVHGTKQQEAIIIYLKNDHQSALKMHDMIAGINV